MRICKCRTPSEKTNNHTKSGDERPRVCELSQQSAFITVLFQQEMNYREGMVNPPPIGAIARQIVRYYELGARIMVRDLTTCEERGTIIKHPVGTNGKIIGSYNGGFVVEQLSGPYNNGQFMLPFSNIEGWSVE